ncbi:ATP-grasp domain-containing protein [Candidatus Dependentiae bacterium]|nr:ATP-grasp domain-containing protein [Candidatus Dependentiae bacterium]
MFLKRAIHTVLIANRSEVALRVQATCHARGLRTIAVYAPEDASLRYVANATAAYPLSGSGSSAYLQQDELIAIALHAGADAVHPGYGFLSEQASFAQRVIQAGLTWIGPSPQAMAAMASKERARTIAQQAEIPTVPGQLVTDLAPEKQESALLAAEKIGFPVIIKDPLGGGGKGMRRVMTAADFPAAWDAVIAEATRQTNTTALLIEKYIVAGRHIEVQVAGDGLQVIHLFERECSIQRRHQKIIEEAPACFLNPELKIALHDAACRLAAAVAYDSIGTVEFIVTPDEKFYFLEMNTRLQVEHGVTELVTGIDLVGLQLDLVRTQQLPFSQNDLSLHGHAIQCRLYAENPRERFMPSTGTIQALTWPLHPQARLEYDLHEGMEITPFFDPMIAKILCYGTNRSEAQRTMSSLLERLFIAGITTNQLLLQGIIRSSLFSTGVLHTQSLADQDLVLLLAQELSVTLEEELIAGLATALASMHKTTSALSDPTLSSRRWRTQPWR